MPQGVLPYKYEEEGNDTGMTALAGLPVYLDLAQVMGLSDSIGAHMHVRGSQGWTDQQILRSLILLNIAGGDCVEDLTKLEKDEGFCRVLRRVELKELSRKERREQERRWRKERRRALPSPSAVFRYLEAFHDAEQENQREAGKAFIPVPNEHLRGLAKVNRDLVSATQKRNPQETATLDMDATLAETTKENALYCYKKYKAYQPLNVWWAEQELMLYTEFRDGNVPAGYEQLRVLKEALEYLPEGVERVRLRSDTAGYQHDLLAYCEQEKKERFGRIEFAIGCDVTKEFKQAIAEVEDSDWKPMFRKVGDQLIRTGREWAEVCFVPNAIGHSKNGPAYRYLATREAMQMDLPGMEIQQDLPFPTLKLNKQNYKVFGTVTNMDWDGEELIHWQHERCGKSEEAHAVMKDDLAGGRFPSGEFGENAAWWWIMVLALNLNAAMKHLVLGKSWATKRMKAIRFSLINLPGRILEHSRNLLIRIAKNHPSLGLLLGMRSTIMELAVDDTG